MTQRKNTKQSKSLAELEKENSRLKKEVKRLSKLACYKVCSYTTTYDHDEFGNYEYMVASCCGELEDEYWDRDWTYCPYCGGKIEWKDQREEDQKAYEMHIDAEIDYRLGK